MARTKEKKQEQEQADSPNGATAPAEARRGPEDRLPRGAGEHHDLPDREQRFMGGYGIVGGNLPLAVGLGLASDYLETDDATVCMFGDGAINQGNFGESLNLAALWSLPVVFMVINNQFGMGTAIERHSAVTDLFKRGDGYGVPARVATAWTCSTCTPASRRH